MVQKDDDSVRCSRPLALLHKRSSRPRLTWDTARTNLLEWRRRGCRIFGSRRVENAQIGSLAESEHNGIPAW